MADLSFVKWSSWQGGIDDSNQKEGGQYFSANVDVYRTPGYLAVADKLTKDVDDNDIGTFTEPIYWFVEDANDIFALDSGGDVWKKDASTGWVNDATWPHADGNTGSGQSMIKFGDDIFWTANTTIGRIQTPTGTPTFTDSWQTGLTSADWHPMAIFLGKLMVGHGRNVGSWDGTTWTAQDLILPDGFITKSAAVIGDFVAFGCEATEGQDARIFLWDGTSATYNKEIHVKETAVDALFTWSNILWVIAGSAANLHFYNGSTLQEVAKIADVDVQGGDSVVVRPSGITQWRNRILIAVNTLSDLGDRVMPGIWAYDPVTGGFTFQFTLSTGVMNTSGNAVSVFNDGTNIYVGGTDTNTGASSSTFVDKSGGSKYTETCWWTSPWIDTNVFANKHMRKIYLNFREWPGAATDEIVVKYRVDDGVRRLNGNSEFTATGGSSNTVTVASTTGLQEGDEVTVTGGPSSGDIRRISGLTSTTITVDRNFTATPVNAQTKFVVERWFEIGTVGSEDDDLTQKAFDISDITVQKIQFKFELRDADTAGEEVAISDISTSFIQKKAI